MTRLALAAAGSAILVAAYSLSPLVAVAVAAIGATALMAVIAMVLQQAEREEVERVMTIIDACVESESRPLEPVRLVS